MADHDVPSDAAVRAPDGAVSHLRVDGEMCQGHGRCYDLEPELFGFVGNGDGVVLRPWLTESDMPAARRAATACPERAIFISDRTVLHQRDRTFR